MFEAVKNGDADSAESLITQHIRRGRDDVIAQFDVVAG
jgi:DNA-binding GntR family transcriptional regulator